MQLIYTEELVPIDIDKGEYLTLHPIFKPIKVMSGQLPIDVATFSERKMYLTCVPPGEKVFATYISAEGARGNRCLTPKMLVDHYYKMKYNTEDTECLGYEDTGIESYIEECINKLQISSSNKRFEKQYHLHVGKTVGNCTTAADIFVPREGMAMIDNGMVFPYTKMEDNTLKLNMDVSIDPPQNIRVGYELPDIGKIISIQVNGRDVPYQMFNGYTFFGCEDQIVNITYYSDLEISDGCCIEFEKVFWRIPVLYALWKNGTNGGDSRRFEWQKDYEELLDDYKKYIYMKSDSKQPYKSAFHLTREYYTHPFKGRWHQ